MSKQVMTLAGEIPASSLGFTLMHEHLMICDWNFRMADPDFLDYKKTLNTIVEVLKHARKSGVRTLVDATTSNMGRDIALMAEAASASGCRTARTACQGLEAHHKRK